MIAYCRDLQGVTASLIILPVRNNLQHTKQAPQVMTPAGTGGELCASEQEDISREQCQSTEWSRSESLA